MDVPATRSAIAAALSGSGIEVGPGHWAFPTPPAVMRVAYVSRLLPEDERRLFPEVPEEHAFMPVDVVADIDHDGLKAFADDSQDFVIASHVVEHLAAPIWGLSEFLRVVRPGGHVVLVLPDRRLTFDRHRAATSVEHLLSEHALGIREIDDVHLRDFLANVEGDLDPSPEALRVRRERRIHAHCWTEPEFRELLSVLQNALGFGFAIEDAYDAEAPGGTGIEFAYRLKVTGAGGPIAAS